MKPFVTSNPKSISFLAIGLIAGGIGGFFLIGDSVSKTDQARVQTLEKEISTLKMAANKPTVTSVSEHPEDPKLMEVVPPNDPPSEEYRKQMEVHQERMKKAIHDRKAMKVAERISALKARLGLTDEQAGSLKNMLMENMKDSSDVVLAGMNQEGKRQTPNDELGTLLSLMNGGNDKELDAKVIELLTPEQQQAYAAFQAEQKANKVEVKANKELAKLQNSMSLSAEQKDRAFSVFSQLAAAEWENPVSPFAAMAVMNAATSLKEHPGFEQLKNEAERFKVAQQKRLAAMKEILSPEQYQIYETQSQQGSMAELMEGIMGDMPPQEAFMFK